MIIRRESKELNPADGKAERSLLPKLHTNPRRGAAEGYSEAASAQCAG
ncbi:hypothetical protein ACFL45_08855 [Candidatus Neomarinimicrobiota bacterium]